MVITEIGRKIQHVMLPVAMVLKCGFENAIALRRLMVATTARTWGKLKNGIPVECLLVKIHQKVYIKLALF